MHMGVGILIYVAAEGGFHSHAQDSNAVSKDFKRKEREVIHTRVDVWLSPPREEMAGHILQLSPFSLTLYLI